MTDDDQDGAAFRSGYNYVQHGATVSLNYAFTDNLEAHVGYGYYATQDDDRGDEGDYQAHVIRTGMTMTF